MKKSITLLHAAIAAACVFLVPNPGLAQDANRCVVASVQPLATDAGLDAFRNGGNAVDAAIAAALTLGVVDLHNSGIGGGCFILIRSPDGSLLAIDGRETAPAAATADMYLRDGKAVAELSRTGPLAVATPGAIAAYDLAIRESGNRSLADLLRPAAQLAERGFAVDRVLAGNLRSKSGDLAKFSGSKAVLLTNQGQPPKQGDTLRQADLANTYRSIAEEGIGWFYRGPFADTVAEWMEKNGGILAAADFAAYKPVRRQPIKTTYRRWSVIGFPPPSSGGVHVAQMLNMLERFDLGSIAKEDPASASHLIVEAMKLAFADRAHWLGDADFAKVPRGLTDKGYARRLSDRIEMNRVSVVPKHGDPPMSEGYFGRHTTHVAAADSEGYWVAITATINTHFGSKVIVPGTGVMLNNEMDDFSAQPGVPNAFGLVGAENNAVAPGKRPLSSMSPTIVLDETGEPIMTVGAAGGPKIITQVLLALIRRLDYGLSVEQAIGLPRFHHQWRPDQVLVEKTLDHDITDRFQKLGHTIAKTSSAGVSQAIVQEKEELVGAHDPRVPGKVGYATR